MRMRAVSSLTGLTSIDLSGCSMTNDGLREPHTAHVSQPHLWTVGLESCQERDWCGDNSTYRPNQWHVVVCLLRCRA
jgi:hypothetical protein